MGRFILCAVIIAMGFIGCTPEHQNVSNMYHSDTARIQGLVNFSLIDSTELPQHIDPNPDDAVVLEIILDYNTANDDTKFANNNGKTINNAELKKRLLLLSNNLR